jgi:hypothetical protein
MAAKKRDGGGSGMGLIVTLVFFVLATVILGVTTYLGFADQAANQAAKDKAVKELKQMEDERAWYRFQARVLRSYMGKPPAGLDVKDLAREKGQFDKGQLLYASNQGDKDEVAKFLKEVDQAMPWDASRDDSPKTTYPSRLEDKDKAYATLTRSADQLKNQKEEAERMAKEKSDELDTEKKNYNSKLVQVDRKVEDDRKKDLGEIDRLKQLLNEENKKKEKVSTALADAGKDLEKATKDLKKLQGQLSGSQKDYKEVRDKLEETGAKLALIASKHGEDLKAMEMATLDAKALQIIRSWNKPWKITRIDKKGTMPYINLGRSDGLTPQVTFSVHAQEPNGSLNPNPKGTVEVVQVIDDNSARVRVTSVKDARLNPILEGDRLFNPTWDPTAQRHIALAGIVELGGEGVDNTDDFRRMMEKQNVVLDAYIDTKDEKNPKVIGKGITTRTDYLVLAAPLESTNHPRSRERSYIQSYDRLYQDMKAKANANGVTLITLRKYLDMIGYRAPKVISSTPALGSGGRSAR